MATALIRTVILYFSIMAALRLTGKRQIGELEPNELVLTMMLSDLAAVPDDRLMKLWEGLGYYSRARNLKKAAQVIVSAYGGKLPGTAEGGYEKRNQYRDQRARTLEHRAG